MASSRKTHHPPQSSSIRFRVEPGDVPPEKAARRLHLTLAEFNQLLPALRRRQFPAPDPTTGMYDLEEIDEWRRSRRSKPPLTTSQIANETSSHQETMGVRFNAVKERRAAEERRRHG